MLIYGCWVNTLVTSSYDREGQRMLPTIHHQVKKSMDTKNGNAAAAVCLNISEACLCSNNSPGAQTYSNTGPRIISRLRSWASNPGLTGLKSRRQLGCFPSGRSERLPSLVLSAFLGLGSPPPSSKPGGRGALRPSQLSLSSLPPSSPILRIF